MSNKYDLVIFDWDGTLVDSADLIVDSMQAAFKEASLTIPTDSSVKNIIGLGIKVAVQVLDDSISESDLLNVCRLYGEHFVVRDIGEMKVFDGVFDLLDSLAKGKTLSAVATCKTRKGLVRGLGRLKKSHCLEITRCADETKSKPHPLMLSEILEATSVPIEKAVMVGDSIYDMEMAQAIGMDSIAVTYGVHSKEQMDPYRPKIYVDSVSELSDFLFNE